jgi:hypothetical protein
VTDQSNGQGNGHSDFSTGNDEAASQRSAVESHQVRATVRATDATTPPSNGHDWPFYEGRRRTGTHRSTTDAPCSEAVDLETFARQIVGDEVALRAFLDHLNATYSPNREVA